MNDSLTNHSNITHNNHKNHNNHNNHNNHAQLQQIGNINVNKNKNATPNPCSDYLSDLEYIEHMIPHHQVAVDMSVLLLEKTNDPEMMFLCRNILKKQRYEIWEMTYMKKQLNDKVFSDDKFHTDTLYSKLDKYAPKLSRSKDGECDPLFFKPDEHMKHMAHMEINDTVYLEHMIPHHQVAVNMSERLLQYTNNSYLLDFSRKLITDQQYEIFLMNNLLKRWKIKSELLE